MLQQPVNLRGSTTQNRTGIRYAVGPAPYQIDCRNRLSRALKIQHKLAMSPATPVTNHKPQRSSTPDCVACLAVPVCVCLKQHACVASAVRPNPVPTPPLTHLPSGSCRPSSHSLAGAGPITGSTHPSVRRANAESMWRMNAEIDAKDGSNGGKHTPRSSRKREE